MVNCPLAYNTIFRRLALNRLKAVTSTYYQLMHFLTEKGIREVRGDQVAGRECYIALLKGESIPRENMSIKSLEVWDERVRVVVESRGELEDIILNINTPDGTTWVGSDLPMEFTVRLRDFLL